MRSSDLVSVCHAEKLQFTNDLPIRTLVIDSRKAVLDEGSVFFAITGERHDGHLFINQLYTLGVRQFVVERAVTLESLEGANVLLVSSSITALQQIASYHRHLFDLPVIGITGSNGKTIVKEWLNQVLAPNLQVVKNPGSYNSQVGVPLSVWEIQAHHEVGIFEAGISRPGEMERLQPVIDPTFGVYTNLGGAHDEGFISRRQKTEEKAKLFTHCERVICCRDHEEIYAVLQERRIPLFTWSLLSRDADVQIMNQGGLKFEVTFRKEKFYFDSPFPDKASQENSFHVLAFMLFRGYRPAVVAERLQTLRQVSMRLELKQGINRSIIIDDSYNNDVAGLRMSLDFLKNQQKSKKSLILSDVFQSGLPTSELIKDLKQIISSFALHRFIGIGPQFMAYSGIFPEGVFYETTSSFLDALDPDDISNEVILVKGARVFQFERIVQRLQHKVHGTVMEIDLNSMVHNLNYFKSRIRPGTKIMAMVKAFAYGSGSEAVANLLQYHRVDYLGVAYADEGIELRKNNITLPIMVMNPSEESFGALLEYDLEPEMYSQKILQAFSDFLEGRKAKVHLKLDTGMHRLGFDETELAMAILRLDKTKNIQVATVFSHLSGADEKMHDDFSKDQAKIFLAMADRLEASLGYKPLQHLLNSPGILRFPEYQFDMVRLGIGLYGVDPTEDGTAPLKPVASLKTMISQIKKIKKNQTIGYGRKGKADKDLVVATLAIGYADGFSRSFSGGRGKVMIKGKLAPVVGNVCMDMTMVDITGISAREGDEAIIFGEGLTIQQLASWINTIPYEILTSTSERVRRVFYAESI